MSDKKKREWKPEDIRGKTTAELGELGITVNEIAEICEEHGLCNNDLWPNSLGPTHKETENHV